MIKLLIGPTLIGAGYLAGSAYGRDAEQIVHKSPSVTYAAVEQALANMRQSGTTSFDGGTPVSYELKIDRTPDQKLVLDLMFNGQKGAEADLDFTPRNDGKDTLMTAKIHANYAVLRPALAGTNKARLAYAPNWMLNLSVQPVLQQLASQIEQGGNAGDAFQGWSPASGQAQWESNLSAEQRQQVGEWQQYEATRPTVDPDADARRFMQNGSSSN
jgi:hypothetical protein